MSLQVHFDAKPLQYKQEGGNYLLDCEVAFAIYDISGKLVETFAETIKGSLTPTQVEQAKQKAFATTSGCV